MHLIDYGKRKALMLMTIANLGSWRTKQFLNSIRIGEGMVKRRTILC